MIHSLCCAGVWHRANFGVGSAQVAANIAIVGLSLYGSGFNGVGNCVQLGIPVRL